MSVETAKAQTATLMLSTLHRFKHGLATTQTAQSKDFERRKSALVRRQRLERDALKKHQQERQAIEARTRQDRFRRGLKGLWDSLRGHNRRIRKANELEALQAARRDRDERDALIHAHLSQRRHVDLFKLELRCEYDRERALIARDSLIYEAMRHGRSRDGPGL